MRRRLDGLAGASLRSTARRGELSDGRDKSTRETAVAVPIATHVLDEQRDGGWADT
ncbi:MAG: hypothetical protein H6700_04600 [Myxococcales bacterium]|nr:hypothetical protein [Myxococcales bacterium]